MENQPIFWIKAKYFVMYQNILKSHFGSLAAKIWSGHEIFWNFTKYFEVSQNILKNLEIFCYVTKYFKMNGDHLKQFIN